MGDQKNIIAFEGIGGVGKTTLVKLLSDQLSDKILIAEEFPHRNKFNIKPGDFRLQIPAIAINGPLLHLSAIATKIDQLYLSASDNVNRLLLLDRFDWSLIAHLIVDYYFEDEASWPAVFNVVKEALNPALKSRSIQYFYLSYPLPICVKRIEKRNGYALSVDSIKQLSSLKYVYEKIMLMEVKHSVVVIEKSMDEYVSIKEIMDQLPEQDE